MSSNNDDVSLERDFDLMLQEDFLEDDGDILPGEDGPPNKSIPNEDKVANTTNVATATSPEPLYKVLDKVYARDPDGVLYLAVIRRRLYGPKYHHQVEMGMVSTINEAILQHSKVQEAASQSTWHYFVHYNNWNVRFDKWVSENTMCQVTPASTELVAKISQEHRTLMGEMRKTGVKGKKGYQTVNGAEFLREWKKRLLLLENEPTMNRDDEKTNVDVGEENNEKSGTSTVESKRSRSNSRAKATNATSKNNTWTRAALAMEHELRQQDLTGKRSGADNTMIMLPFALKKVIVQQWEMINQCHMLSSLPATTTIRQALDKYLGSKEAMLVQHNDSKPSPTKCNPENTTESCSSDKEAGPVVSESDVAGDSPIVHDTAVPNGPNGPAKLSVLNDSDEVERQSRNKEWRDMTDGISILFDEALPSRLLYRAELPQRIVLDNMAEYATTPYSEIYGSEHLLRLFVRLPDMLVDNLSEVERRPILAKVNDFIRFLHKNQGTLLTQTHRKFNELELKEKEKQIRMEEKKRSMQQLDTTHSVSKKLRL